MGSIKTTHLDGDVSVGRHITSGGNADIAGSTHIGHDLVVDGWLEAPNIRGANKGFFLDEAKLQEAYPKPQKGWWAVVGDSIPGPIYVVEKGKWKNSGKIGGVGGSDFSQLREELNGFIQIGISQNVTLSFVDGEYVSNNWPNLSVVKMGGLSKIVLSNVSEGERYFLCLGREITDSVDNYFAFAVDANTCAINSNELAKYVSAYDADTGGYVITIPPRCKIFFSACLTTKKQEIYAKKLTKNVLKWLKVLPENIDTNVFDAILAKIPKPQPYNIVSLYDSLKRPFDFRGKNITFFGDSITSGVCSPMGTGISNTNGYAYRLTSMLGATMRLQSVSGSGFCDRGDGLKSILSNIKEYKNESDIVIVAGGTNDWNRGVKLGVFGSTDISTFYGALNESCAHLQKVCGTKPVIFITPIPYTTTNKYKSIAPLDDYRVAIYEVATYFGFNVISGATLGMPVSAGGWSNEMCHDSDGCHPTIEGHKLMARNICGKLL